MLWTSGWFAFGFCGLELKQLATDVTYSGKTKEKLKTPFFT